MKISKDALREAIASYEDCVPIAEIAGWLGVSRQGLWKAIKKSGVETRKELATRREMVCDNCGEKYSVTRSEYRIKRGRKKHFCGQECYTMYLADEDTVINRHCSRVSRGKVAEIFDLGDEHIVHHIDKNQMNTHISNLMVFASSSDHIKYHHELRQGEVTVKPLWDGRNHTAEDPYYARIRPYSKDRQLGKGGDK